jgi:hypothetical protein
VAQAAEQRQPCTSESISMRVSGEFRFSCEHRVAYPILIQAPCQKVLLLLCPHPTDHQIFSFLLNSFPLCHSHSTLAQPLAITLTEPSTKIT